MKSFMENPANAKAMKWDPLGVGGTFQELTMSLLKQPEKIVEAQLGAWNAYMDLWKDSTQKMMGGSSDEPASKGGDRRFKHDSWNTNPFFDYVKQSYLVASDTIQSLVADAEGLDPNTARKAEFYTRQFVDALSPSNFALTNPEVLEATISSKGDNLVRGMKNFLEDFDTDKGQLRMKMTDVDAFELGENVGTSKGKVVFENRMLQLIQYSPSTEEVYARPLMIIPPWINKFYILDLQEKNSFIKWTVDQGYTVFVVSWVNPDESYRDTDFEQYLLDGSLKALDVVEEICGGEKVNVIGYCIGGTLLTAMLAYMQAKADKRFTSATFFTTMIDFSEPGDLGVFIDEEQLSNLEEQMFERGYHDGKNMAMTFNLLRANDLIWSFFINNYMLGKEPFPFDLLYWNSDSTRMPAKMHSTYLRTMYLKNEFKDPGGMTLDGVPIDARTIKTPSYFLSAEDDHIAPWKSTYLGAQLFSGPTEFVLGKSGHIAGVINPPSSGKYGYYLGPKPKGIDADKWYEKTEKHDGSWWSHWEKWLAKKSGDKVKARVPGSKKYPALEAAPGSYAKA